MPAPKYCRSLLGHETFSIDGSNDAIYGYAPGVNISVVQTVEQYLDELSADWRTVAPGEWGLTLEAAGWPLHIGIALRDGLLRVQAQIAAANAISSENLLWWNRRLLLVRFSATRSGEPWLQLDLPTAAVNQRELDRMLGLFVLTATQAREVAQINPYEG